MNTGYTNSSEFPRKTKFSEIPGGDKVGGFPQIAADPRRNFRSPMCHHTQREKLFRMSPPTTLDSDFLRNPKIENSGFTPTLKDVRVNSHLALPAPMVI